MATQPLPSRSPRGGEVFVGGISAQQDARHASVPSVPPNGQRPPTESTERPAAVADRRGQTLRQNGQPWNSQI